LAIIEVYGIDAGNSFDLSFDGALFEAYVPGGEYFDGASEGATWSGTAHASSSSITISDASLITRHNLLANPSFETDLNGDGRAYKVDQWSGLAGNPIYSQIAGRSGLAQRISYTGLAGDVDEDTNWQLNYGGSALTACQSIAFSAYLKGTNSAINVNLVLVYYDASDQWLGHSWSDEITLSASWSRHAVRAAAPAGCARVACIVHIDDVDQGETLQLDLDDALLERSATLRAYFDGDHYAASWDGAADLSASTLDLPEHDVAYSYGANGRIASLTDSARQTSASYAYDAAGQRTSSVVRSGFPATTTSTEYTYDGLQLLSLAAARGEARHNRLPNPSFERDVDEDGLAESLDLLGSYNGTPSTTLIAGRNDGLAQRLTYSGVAADSNEVFEPAITLAAGSFAGGDPYTFSLYLKGSLSGTGAPYIGVICRNAGGTIIDDTYAEIDAPGASWQRVQISGVCPANTSYVRCYLWLDGLDTGNSIDLSLDEALLEKRVGLGEYFDGETQGASWDGAAAASASTLTAPGYRIDYLHDEEGVPYGGVYRELPAGGNRTYFSMITTDRGDVVELLDRNGDPFAAYRYDEWGNPIGAGSLATGVWTDDTNSVSSTLAGEIATRQVLRYAGYAYDAESGLYYCSARYFDPYSRQWTSRDPISSDGEESAYQYCGGEPVAHRDPTGWQRWRTANMKIVVRSSKTGNAMRVKFIWQYNGTQVRGGYAAIWPVESYGAKKVGWRWCGGKIANWHSTATYQAVDVEGDYQRLGPTVVILRLVGFVGDIPIIVPSTLQYHYEERLQISALLKANGRCGVLRGVERRSWIC
jgi:RHS repeat-associated protein